ncbi:hypothetical protein BLNAU_7139 [Blattamonas nauphoetae]|uniref:Uncharacterized protein n=1 Tax=Blattamonas nauphoetae TaxID=2049346 RepID=A0ABQ9Y2J1_9EUKA|nr:hypothetical protein BLNAU_7139 [Blattamonas nauphoetae]
MKPHPNSSQKVRRDSILLSGLHFDCGWEGICLSKITASTLTFTSCTIPQREMEYRFALLTARTNRQAKQPFSPWACFSRPLLDFSSLPSGRGDVRMTDIGMETSLVAGNFRNVTSSPSQTVIPSSLFSQKIIGTAVSHSTNHLTGTASLDMNDGGDLLCVNSSFAHCDSSLEPSEGPNSSLQHASSSDTQYKFDASTPESEIVFTRCTFLSMKASSLGSAIYHYRAPSSLSISECSFAHIQSSATSGGAVSFYHSEAKCPFTLTKSSFVNCSASDYGGSVCVRYATTATVTLSFFKNSTGRDSDADGGAISVHNTKSVVLSSSVFQNCSAGSSSFGGGGLSIRNCEQLSMNSLQFRGCRGKNGKDVWSVGVNLTDLTSNVTNCDSTSDTPSWYFADGGGNDTSLIPQTTTTRTLKSIQTTLREDEMSATFLATVSATVEGTMLVLVDNTDSHEQATDHSAPAIQRLLFFPFTSPTTTSSLVLTFGGFETLQLASTYSVVGSSISGTNLSSNSISFDTPDPTRLTGVVCRSGTGLDHAWLGLVGRGVAAGTYVCRIVGIDDFELSVTFDGSTESGTQNMLSSQVSISLFEEGSKFSFNTLYEVNLVTKQGSPEPVFLDPSRLLFTTPDPPRLMGVGEVRFTDHSKTSIEVDLVCGGLPVSTHTLTVSSANGTEISLSVKRSDSSNAKATAVVYSVTGGTVKLMFGETYTITSISNTVDSEFLFVPLLTFTVPSEPARIEAVSEISLNSAKTQLGFTMTGKDFFSQNFVVVVTRSSIDVESSSPINFVSETEMTVAFTTGLIESSTVLKYGTTYTLKSVSNATHSFAVNPSLRIPVPSAPIVTSISSSLSTNLTHFQLLLTGTNLPSTGTYTASLLSGETFEVIFLENRGTSKWFEGNATSSLTFNTSYTINTLISDEEHIVLQKQSFTTPEGPTLTGIEATLGSNPDFVDLTLDVKRITQVEWTLVVVEQGKTTEFSFPITFMSSSEGHTSVSVYNTKGSLEYSKIYQVKRLLLGTLTAAVPSPVTFTTPPEPARIESVSAVQNAMRTHIIVTMRGRALPTGSFSLSLSERPSETFTGTLKSEGIVQFEISLNHNTTPHLDYHSTYTLHTLSAKEVAVILNPGLQFNVLGKGFVVIVSGSDGDDVSTCGTVQKPCSSIRVGLERVLSDQEVEDSVVRIDKQSGFGGGVEVSGMSVVIEGMWGMKGEIVVEEGITTPKGKEGLLMLSGGEVILSELSLSLPSFAHTLSSTHPLFVIGGWGKCSMEHITMCGMDGEQIGMGLCGLVSGRVSMTDVYLKASSFSDGVSLISHSVPSNELEMILSDVVIENCTVVNAPLISFNSTHHSSSFSLVNSQFVSTRMIMSDSTQNVKGLVDISTPQTTIEIVGCVFVDCGTSSQNKLLSGSTLRIVVGSSSSNVASSRWDVSLASCLFVNNSGVGSGDSTGGVWIWLNEADWFLRSSERAHFSRIAALLSVLAKPDSCAATHNANHSNSCAWISSLLTHAILFPVKLLHSSFLFQYIWRLSPPKDDAPLLPIRSEESSSLSSFPDIPLAPFFGNPSEIIPTIKLSAGTYVGAEITVGPQERSLTTSLRDSIVTLNSSNPMKCVFIVNSTKLTLSDIRLLVPIEAPFLTGENLIVSSENVFHAYDVKLSCPPPILSSLHFFLSDFEIERKLQFSDILG